MHLFYKLQGSIQLIVLTKVVWISRHELHEPADLGVKEKKNTMYLHSYV